jgi:succinyl-CoA synthetase beta subunit
MNIHEYQAKAVLREFGAPVLRGKAVFSVEEAEAAAKELSGPLFVVKSQIHAGGRGKGKFKEREAGGNGGVRLAKSIEEVKRVASEMLGRTLVTAQTGPAGKQVNRLYIEEGSSIARECYLSMLVDRQSSRAAFVVSTEGGVDIEKVAHDTPDRIASFAIDPATGVMAHHGHLAAKALGLTGDLAKQAEMLITQLYDAFVAKDMSLLEINPLIVTKDNKLVCLDAKMSFDDNALFRRPHIAELRDKSQEDPRETYASDRGLAYVGLDGDIGCVVNGAGLAMATLDMIKLAGGEPANFLDIGGGASPERVAKSFKAVLKDKKVKALLLNVFAGINRCDWVAKGVVDAITELHIKMPVVVRLAGTNVEEGRRILNESGLTVITAETLAEAAQKAVAAAKSAAH